MKPFNLEEAKAGKPVCTRDGREARILCFDVKNEKYPIAAIIKSKIGDEYACIYTNDGRCYANDVNSFDDLMMATEKKKGWMNMYRTKYESCIECAYTSYIYNTKEDALAHILRANNTFVGTFPFEWEE